MFRGLFFLFIVCIAFMALADDAEIGREIYHENCSSCHGREMLKPGLAFDLKKFPKDDFQRFQNSVLDGKGSGMPAWKLKLSVEDVKLIWIYVKTGWDN